MLHAQHHPRPDLDSPHHTDKRLRIFRPDPEISFIQNETAEFIWNAHDAQAAAADDLEE